MILYPGVEFPGINLEFQGFSNLRQKSRVFQDFQAACEFCTVPLNFAVFDRTLF